jgi:hypothetical protein
MRSCVLGEEEQEAQEGRKKMKKKKKTKLSNNFFESGCTKMKRSNDDDDSDAHPPSTFAMIPGMMNDLGQLALELGTLDDTRSRLQNRMGKIRARLWEHGPAFIVANIEHFAPMYNDKLREALHPIVDFDCNGNRCTSQTILACGGQALVHAGEYGYTVMWFPTPQASASNADLSYWRRDTDGVERHEYCNRIGWDRSQAVPSERVARILDVLKDDRNTVLELMCKLHDTLEKFRMDPRNVWNQAEAQRAAKRAKEQQQD